MKHTIFLEKIQNYTKILEASTQLGNPTGIPSPDMQGMAPGGPEMPQQPPQNQQPQQEQEKASQGYTMLTNIILDAFKTIKPLNHGDVKYSNNKARDSKEAFKYFEIVKRNLPVGIQHKIANIGGKGGFGDVDELTIVNMANLAIQALFTTPKDQESTEFSTISSIEEVTPDNAKQVYNQIRDYLSVVEK